MKRYFFSVGLFLLGLGLRFLIMPVEAGLAYATFYPILVVCAVCFGLGPSLLYTVLSAVVGTYIFTPPFYGFGPGAIVPVTTFVIGALAILIALESYRRRFNESSMGRSVLQMFVKRAPAALAMLDMDMKYLAVSDRWLKIYGISGDVIGKSHYDIFPTITDAWKAYHRRCLAGEVIRSDEDHFVLQDGTTQWLRWELAPWRSDNNDIGGMIIFVEDITTLKHAEAENRQMQRQLLQTQKLDSIGRLTGGIAHDFNNTLATMLGYAELLGMKRDSEPALPVRAQQYISQIITAGSRAKELIAKMLIFSRSNSEQTSGATPAVLLAPVIAEVLQLLRSSIPSTTELIFQPPDDPLCSRIQPVQLHQIVMNLIINAHDAIDEYGRIEVTLRQAYLSGTCSSCLQNYAGNYVELSVSDNGTGIPEPLIANIFDPFFTTKPVSKGTGMGLSVVHGIVHGLGGHIRLVSSEAGTTVQILMPVADAGDVATPVVTDWVAATENNLGGRTIMVVDDEQSLTSMLEQFLSMQGATVSSFCSPTDALAAFLRDPDGFDLVITDMTMPKLSGLDMATAMLKQRPQLPVLLCTGYSDQVDRAIARQNGIAGFMAKPVNLNDMLQWIKDADVRHV